MAVARRVRSAVRVLATASLIAALLIVTTVPATAAADPSPSPAAVSGSPTCLDRFPADGPGGVDLLLGCVVNEVTRAYTGAGAGTSADPPRLSAYAIPIAIIVAAAAALTLLLVRVLRQGAGRRLAPAMPAAWWSCPACRSLNAAGRRACYRCGRVFEAGATELRVDAEPLAPQSFGRRIDVETSDRPPEQPTDP